MAWKISEVVRARQQFVTERLALKRGDSMARLCARYGISRECGHKWWRRFKAEGRPGLLARSRLPQSAQRLQTKWWERLRVARRQCQDFGPKKLRWELRRTYPHERPPALRTIARWLERLGLVRRRKRRAPSGPRVRLPGRLVGCRVNDVWTVDLKGSFCTRDRHRINALTVRDLASRFVLCVRHVGRGGEPEIAAVMNSLFRRYGLPRALRMDNGGPFGALGPRGWSRLSVRWIKLGLRLEYGRPGCPQDNAEHEQMHRILKQGTACPAAQNLRAQQRRFARWCRWYNYRRPHESIGMRVPASRYQRSPRVWPKRAPAWIYPAHWVRLQLDAKGRCRWRNAQRLIGRAFAHEALGGKSLGPDVLAIYLGAHLLGTLHASDRAGLRPVEWRVQPKPVAGGAQPLPRPPHDL